MKITNYVIIFLFILMGCSTTYENQNEVNKKNTISSKKIIIAHRGASGYLPEHTLEGVILAHTFGVDFIEPDVVLTKDNKAVILHDHHLDTTTNVSEVFPKRKRRDGRYYAIDFTLREIKRLNVYERFDRKSKKRKYKDRFPLEMNTRAPGLFKVPTFDEFIKLVQSLNRKSGRKVGIYPEIKQPEFHTREGKNIARIVLKIIRKYGYEKPENHNQIFIQCFYPPTIKYLKDKLKTKIPLIQLIADNSWKESSYDYDKLMTKKGLADIAPYVAGIGPWIPQIFPSHKYKKFSKTNLVEDAHALGLKVHPYTVRADELPEFAQSYDHLMYLLFHVAKVDGVFTDFGDMAVKWISVR